MPPPIPSSVSLIETDGYLHILKYCRNGKYRGEVVLVPSFLTLTLSSSCSHHFTAGEGPPVPTEQGAGWAPEQVRTFSLPRIELWVVQPIA